MGDGFGFKRRIGIAHQVVWEGPKLHVTGHSWLPVLAIFIGWLPILAWANVLQKVATIGLGALFTSKITMLVAVISTPIALYCALYDRRISFDFESKVVRKATRHFFFWHAEETPLTNDVTLCSDYSYGPMSLGGEPSTHLFLRLRLMDVERHWILSEQSITPPSDSFRKVSQEHRELIARISAELDDVSIDDQLDNETHRMVLPVFPLPEKLDDLNLDLGRPSLLSTLLFMVFSVIGLLVAVAGLIFLWAGAWGGAAVVLFGLVFLLAGLFPLFYRRRYEVDWEQRTLKAHSGWFRVRSTEQYLFDSQSLLVMYPGLPDEDFPDQFRLSLRIGDQQVSIPLADAHTFESVFRRAESISAHCQVPIELNGGMVVHRFQQLKSVSGS